MREPTISLCMIVKNEEQNLPRCLGSVRGAVDEIVVVDTGSTDGTVALAESCGARVLHQPWNDDFAAARNVGVGAATSDWILVLDADEELHQEDRQMLREICRNPEVEAYSMLHLNLIDVGGALETENSYDVTLWRHRPQYRYEGRLHEQIVTAIWRLQPGARVDYCDKVRIIHYGYMSEAVRAGGKSERNLRLIRKLVQEHPDDPFHRFNLGMELQRMGALADAVAEYQRARVGLTGWPLWAAKLFKCMASCLIVQERWEEGREVLLHGLSVFPAFTDLVFLLGLIEQKQGRHARAVGLFHRAIAMGPASEAGAWPGTAGHRAYEAMGQSYALLGQFDAAIAAYEAAYGEQPDWTGPLARIVELLTGHHPDEQIRARLSHHVDPATVAGRIRMADVLLSGGRPDMALATLEDDAPAKPAVLFLRGLSLLRLGRYGEAEQALAAVPPQTAASVPSMLLAATLCRGGSEGLEATVRQRGLGPAPILEAAQFFLGEARFWERVGRQPTESPPWRAGSASEEERREGDGAQIDAPQATLAQPLHDRAE